MTLPAQTLAEIAPPPADVPGKDAPVRVIDAQGLKRLGERLNSLFDQYRADRRIAELRWLRNQRQYLGVYDPEIEKLFSANRSQAYPKLTRTKVISVVSRLMNLMFPGNEKNWELKASPSPDMKPEDVKEALQKAQKRDQDAGIQTQMDLPYAMAAMQQLADERAEELVRVLEDQLEELGGDQTYDYVQLNRRAIFSGVLYGLGVLRGPFVRESKATVWTLGADGVPSSSTKTVYKPQFDFLPIWDFYPDMSAKTLQSQDGYFVRSVMSRAQVRALADRADFFADQIKKYLKDKNLGNYKAKEFEVELRAMGVKVNVNEMKAESSKYEVISWHGKVTGQYLADVGIEVADDKLADDLDAEIWMIDGNVIKADLNPWVELGVDVKTVHTFLFDEDDTSPLGQGLPNIMRDSQMSVAAMARMFLDNASVICGPNLELNTQLLRPDQDLTSTSAYKIWYRDDADPLTAAYPAVRDVKIEGHLDELQKGIEMFMKFADDETFVGPATGGDMEKAPSEPMRTAAGASMLRGDAALPFKDIIRSFDSFTQSVIESLVKFNLKFNPEKVKEGDFNVIARGASSLVAKEIRGMQLDQLATTLTDGEKLHVDDRKMAEARFKVRDLGDMLVTEEEAARRKTQKDQADAAQQKQVQDMAEAQVRKVLSDAFKNISQGQKNSAMADAASVKAALDVLEKGLSGAFGQTQGAGDPANPQQGAGDDGSAGGAQPAANAIPGPAGQAGQQLPG